MTFAMIYGHILQFKLTLQLYISNFLYLHHGQTIYFQGFVNLRLYFPIAGVCLGKPIINNRSAFLKRQVNRHRQTTATGQKKG